MYGTLKPLMKAGQDPFAKGAFSKYGDLSNSGLKPPGGAPKLPGGPPAPANEQGLFGQAFAGVPGFKRISKAVNTPYGEAGLSFQDRLASLSDGSDEEGADVFADPYTSWEVPQHAPIQFARLQPQRHSPLPTDMSIFGSRGWLNRY